MSALEHLAERLGVEELPDVIADKLDSHLLWTAYHMSEEEHWGEVEREAGILFNVYSINSPCEFRDPEYILVFIYTVQYS